jgi:hypothetical protein
MFLQIIGSTERLFALVTFEFLLSSCMNPTVSLEVAGLCKGLATNVARKWLFASVNPPVCFQIRILGDNLITFIAGE